MLDSYRVKKLNSMLLDIKRKVLFSFFFFLNLVKGVWCMSISRRYQFREKLEQHLNLALK